LWISSGITPARRSGVDLAVVAQTLSISRTLGAQHATRQSRCRLRAERGQPQGPTLIKMSSWLFSAVAVMNILNSEEFSLHEQSCNFAFHQSSDLHRSLLRAPRYDYGESQCDDRHEHARGRPAQDCPGGSGPTLASRSPLNKHLCSIQDGAQLRIATLFNHPFTIQPVGFEDCCAYFHSHEKSENRQTPVTKVNAALQQAQCSFATQMSRKLDMR